MTGDIYSKSAGITGTAAGPATLPPSPPRKAASPQDQSAAYWEQRARGLEARLSALQADLVVDLRRIEQRALDVAHRHADVHDEVCPRFPAQDIANMAAAAARRVAETGGP